jgi:hypothetical protein
MQQIKTKSILSFIAVLLLSVSTNAQTTSKYTIGINVGTFVSGDLSPSMLGSWKTPGFTWGLNGWKRISSTLAARLDLGFGTLRGDEARYSTPEYRQYRAFAFNSRVREAIISAEWSPLGSERKLSPYLFGGLGYASMKITRDYSRFNADYFAGEPSLKELLARDVERPLPGGIAIVPIGAGLKYALNNRFSATVEASQRFTRSDYVDGFSYSGNPGLKDNYLKISIGLRYSFGKDSYGCPTVKP